MLTEEQLKMRQSGIGASEVAAVLGMSPFESALDVYMRKLDLTEPIVESEAMEWGSALEEAIAKKYAKSHPEVFVDNMNMTCPHKKEPWMLATPDRIIKANDRSGIWLLEIKNVGLRTGALFGEPGTDQVPQYYLTQAIWQMAVMNLERCDFAILIAGQKYREYTVYRNKDVEEQIIKRIRAFWFDNVKAKVPPAPDASENAKKALAKLYPTHVEDFLEPTAEIETIAANLKDARVALKKAEAQALYFENALKARLKYKQGVISTVGKITWKTGKDKNKVDYKAVCEELGASDSLILKHTTTKQASRTFLVPRSWAKEAIDG